MSVAPSPRFLLLEIKAEKEKVMLEGRNERREKNGTSGRRNERKKESR
jgi:hypothetical protein